MAAVNQLAQIRNKITVLTKYDYYSITLLTYLLLSCKNRLPVDHTSNKGNKKWTTVANSLLSKLCLLHCGKASLRHFGCCELGRLQSYCQQTENSYICETSCTGCCLSLHCFLSDGCPKRTGVDICRIFPVVQWCRNAVPVNILGPERRSGCQPIRAPGRNAIAAAFRQMFAVKIGFASSEIRPCLMQFALLNYVPEMLLVKTPSSPSFVHRLSLCLFRLILSIKTRKYSKPLNVVPKHS